MRPPSPGMQPPITSSWRRRLRTLSQSASGGPGGRRCRAASRRRPRARARAPRSSSAAPSPRRWRGRLPAAAVEARARRAARGAARRAREQRAPVELEQVEGDEGHRGLGGAALDPDRVGEPHPALKALKLGRPSASKATTSPSRIAWRSERSRRSPPARDSGRGRRSPRRAADPSAPSPEVGERADAVPLDLERPVLRPSGGASPCARASARGLCGIDSARPNGHR